MANSFNKMIDEKIIKRGKTSLLIPLDYIFFKEDFNRRVDNERYRTANEEFYQYMLSGGKVPNLEVIPRDEGGVWVVEGHRRTLMYRRLRDEAGKPVEFIKIEPFEGNDVDRIARIRTSNNQLSLTDYEEALLVRDLQNLNLSPDKIAEALHIPRYKVDNAIILISANNDVHQLVEEGVIDIPLAVERVKKFGENAGEILKVDADGAKEKGKKRATKSTAIPQFSAKKSRTVLELLSTDDFYTFITESDFIPNDKKMQVLEILDQYKDFEKENKGESADPGDSDKQLEIQD
ncbi:MAG: chromosome partitioning protein ParB [Serratia sp. (in: enterobacteria)]|uniref:chromosome partitioning protein ParB n=1 Tax=Serratia sp. (in: enterobacteria) TaxID=616 RepID=UPI003F3988B0